MSDNDDGLDVTDAMISTLRERLEPAVSAAMSHWDCVRFIRARNGDITKAKRMIDEWWEWRHTELPGAHRGVTPANILRTTNDRHLLLHPQKELLTHMLHGEDRHGRPIYWEKTGLASSHYGEVKKIWSVDDLIQMHIRSQEITELRLEHASRMKGHPVNKSIVVLDLQNINMKPDFQAISYSRRQLQTDQNYYPERLHRLFIINAPWFFTAIFALVSPFMDSVTRAKIQILGAKESYLPALLADIDESQIPEELGGTMTNCPWNGPFEDRYGCSDEQINAKVAEMMVADGSDVVLTAKEGAALTPELTEDKTDLEELS